MYRPRSPINLQKSPMNSHMYAFRYAHTHHLCMNHQPYEERWGAGVETQKNVRERLGDGVEYHLMSPTPRR